MNIKELKEKLNEFPDDMEVLLTEEISGVLPLRFLECHKLNLVQYHEFNGRPFEYRVWEYPHQFKREILKTEPCLILFY